VQLVLPMYPMNATTLAANHSNKNEAPKSQIDLRRALSCNPKNVGRGEDTPLP
jgi:hypothetical protein